LAYTDADEDAERMLSFDDAAAPADEWVETHAGRRANLDIGGNVGIIDDIPDLDGDAPNETETVTNAMSKASISAPKGSAINETPDLDEIPDMEEEGLEEGDEAAVAPVATTSGIKEYVLKFHWFWLRVDLTYYPVKRRRLPATCCKYGNTT
jgi:ubiquitin-like-conjugating enzyme ATG3